MHQVPMQCDNSTKKQGMCLPHVPASLWSSHKYIHTAHTGLDQLLQLDWPGPAYSQQASCTEDWCNNLSGMMHQVALKVKPRWVFVQRHATAPPGQSVSVAQFLSPSTAPSWLQSPSTLSLSCSASPGQMNIMCSVGSLSVGNPCLHTSSPSCLHSGIRLHSLSSPFR